MASAQLVTRISACIILNSNQVKLHVGFVVDEMALEQISLQLFRFFIQIIIIPPLMHTSLPAPYKSTMIALVGQNFIISSVFNFGVSSP